MTEGTAQKTSNAILSGLAGLASFVFSLTAFLHLKNFDEQLIASLIAGTFSLLICYAAAERPNSESARALAALGRRLLAVADGDLVSPAPAALRRAMPKLAAAVDLLFAEVRSSIDNAHALGMYDPVTSLPNRLHFRAEADRLISARGDGQLAAMLFVDLDRFKSVNDNLGHARGDQLLIMVANRLRLIVAAECGEAGSSRPLLARLAGDEFTLFFPRVARIAEIERIARRVVLSIAQPFELHGHCVDVGASLGVAICPSHGDSVEGLMRAADIAMYHAKSRGGGQYRLFSDELAARHRAKTETEQALGEAVQRNEFVLALQPQLDLRSDRVTGAEALLHWNHPRDGLRQPASFIAIAEQTGHIAEIGEWVMGEVAAMLAGWQGDGPLPRIAFNVSPRQLDRADFFARLRQIFAHHGVPLSRIELEFTETAAMRCSEADLAQIAALRADGAMIAIDDFGTGYSNLARLRTMPLDRVKLDQSLITELADSERARTIVQAVIGLIKGVGAEVIAEAVETEAQADILRTMGCDTLQGFLFARPMFEQELRDWISSAKIAERQVA